MIIQIGKTGGFARYGIGIVFLSYHNRCASQCISRGNNTVFSENQHGTGAFHLLVDHVNTVYKRVAHIY